MEGIVALIIVIVGIVGSLNKSKKVVKNRPGQGNQPPAQPDFTPIAPAQKAKKSQSEIRAEAPAERTVYRAKPAEKPAPAAKPARPARPIPGPVAAPARPGQSVMPSLQDLLQSFVGEDEKPAAPKPADAIAEATSPVDEKGCVGGSLPHDATAIHEGDTVKKMPPRLEFKHPDASADFELQHGNLRVSAEDLRRAVVMAEILGKPKALRPRGERL